MDRRSFCLSSAAALSLPLFSQVSFAASKPDWQIGCFNRPWLKWSFEEAMKGVKSAGYSSTGFILRNPNELFTDVDADPQYVAKLKDRVAESGVDVILTALRIPAKLDLIPMIQAARKQIDHAATLGIDFVMSFGADNPDEFDNYIKMMRDASNYAADKGIKVVMKPHGGISASAKEILDTIESVGHPNFSIWYDAGNIIHYTGKDPVAELDQLVPHISGFCAKDCATLKGDVMIQFGTGKVDFVSVFQKLKDGGFKGPIMVECCQVGETPDATAANAKANREFLEKAIAQVN